MLKIKLQRVGRKNDAKFRLVVTEQKSKPKSGELELLGFYDPKTNDSNFKIDRINYWISKGAQPSDTTHNLLIKKQIISGKKIAVHKQSKKKEEAKA